MEEVFELFEVVVWTAVLEAEPRQGNPHVLLRQSDGLDGSLLKI